MDKPTTEGRSAAGKAAAERMHELGLSIAELARRSGFSANTIRGMTQGTGRHHKSVWVAISAVLGFEPDYLVNILNGEVDRNDTAEVTLEAHLEKLAEAISEIGALRKDVAEMKDVILRMNEKFDGVIGWRSDARPRLPPGYEERADLQLRNVPASAQPVAAKRW